MERKEFLWLMFLVVVFLIVNVFTLSPLVPWQQWNLWSQPTPDKQVEISFGDYRIELPSDAIEITQGEMVEFIATSSDVTYGFGVFRSSGPLLFQMQVLPGHQNRIWWRFDEVGTYNVRSTEYSGPKHPEMFVPDAIRVIPGEGAEL